jgi:type IV pilus assembly protein PilQ
MNIMTNKDGIIMDLRTFTMTCWNRTSILASQLFVTMGLLLLVGVAHAAELRSIDYSALPGDKAKIQLTFSEPVSEPHSFSTDDPARIVIDLAGVQNKLVERTKQVNVGVTRSISAVEAGDRTRMVINLLQKVPYTISQQGNQVLITIDNEKSVATKRSVASGTTNVSDIDFRRGENGEARLIVKLDGENVAMDVRQERGDIVVELVNAALPDNLRRRLDVVDFATPVQFIDAEGNQSATKLTLTTQGKYEHLAYQSDNTLIVEVSPIADDIQAGQGQNQFGYTGEKLSLNFQNIEVRAVLQLLADFTGMNLVTSDTVKGNLTLRLKNVPWDQALDIILKSKGLAMRQNGNVMMVAPAAEIAAREKQELDAKKQQVELEPLYTEIVEIKFAKAEEIAELLRGDETQRRTSSQSQNIESKFLSPRGSITVDERTNSLIIRDTAHDLAEVSELIETLDRPVRQVLIESRIVIANNDFNKELGVRFGTSAQSNTLGAGTSGSLDGLSLNTNNDDQIRADNTVGNDLNVNLPVINPSGSIGLALAKLPLGMILELELSAMEAEGQGEIVSSPRVITSNQKKATIKQGTEIPYQEATSSGATNVSFKEAVLSLDVTPQITPDDRIVMDLVVTKDSVGERFLGVPSIDTKSVETQVLVDNGETVVLGGVYEQTTADAVERVPFFGELPYVGFLFRNNFKQDEKEELLIFVTPKIVKEGLQY